ncbi:Uncharacterised protein [Citrobacter freundii]|nr:Uncharacterised protein [Citrobacter freundii]
MCGRFSQSMTREDYLALLAEKAELNIPYDPEPISSPKSVFETDFIGNIFNKLAFLAGISALLTLIINQLITRLSILNIPTLFDDPPFADLMV